VQVADGDSVFSAAAGDAAPAGVFSKQELERLKDLFPPSASPGTAAGPLAKPPPQQLGATATGLPAAGGEGEEKRTLLTAKRAQNAAVVLSRLRVEEVVRCLTTMDAGVAGGGLSVEMLERVRSILPSEEETFAFMHYPEEEVEQLRDVERRLRELYRVSRLSQRLRMMSGCVSVETVAEQIRGDCDKLLQVCRSLRASPEMRQVVQCVLSMGNFLNYGETEKSGWEVQSFGLVEGLNKLGEFRLGDKGLSLMHVVVRKVVAAESTGGGGVRRLGGVVEQGSRVSTELIVGGIHGIRGDLGVIQNEMKMVGYSEEAQKNMEILGRRMEEILRGLTELWNETDREIVEIRKFFGEDPKKCTFEDFVLVVKNFILAFIAAQAELTRNPNKLPL
jgi:hypothetical protein